MPMIGGRKVTLWKAAARASDLLYVAATIDELMEEQVSHSAFVSLYRGEWRSAGTANWATAAICVVRAPTERLLAVSEDGDGTTYVSGKQAEEKVVPAPATLRGLTTIGGRAYACGMFREVFARTGEGEWRAIGAPRPRERVPSGFEAIDGFDETNIYAVGWRGEIWQRKRGEWRQHDSPSNVILTGVCCAPDGFVYACGQNGVLLKGRDDGWTTIDYDLPREDLWDIHAFGDRVFAAGFTDLLEIKGGSVEAVDLGDDAPVTCHRLTSAEGVLWSVGSEDVFAFTGDAWRRVV